MRTVRIKRFNDSGVETLGGVFIDDISFCLSLELEWNNNKVSASCIPRGEYECTWHESPKYGWCYIVNDVPLRSHILFHAGNTSDDTRGCILLGRSIGKINGENAVLNSRVAIRNFHTELDKKPFKLVIE